MTTKPKKRSTAQAARETHPIVTELRAFAAVTRKQSKPGRVTFPPVSEWQKGYAAALDAVADLFTDALREPDALVLDSIAEQLRGWRGAGQ